jgi:hypothetical protein
MYFTYSLISFLNLLSYEWSLAALCQATILPSDNLWIAENAQVKMRIWDIFSYSRTPKGRISI